MGIRTYTPRKVKNNKERNTYSATRRYLCVCTDAGRKCLDDFTAHALPARSFVFFFLLGHALASPTLTYCSVESSVYIYIYIYVSIVCASFSSHGGNSRWTRTWTKDVQGNR